MNMLKSIFKSALPHIIAVAIFAIVAIIYCKPALDGKVLQQSDMVKFAKSEPSEIDMMKIGMSSKSIVEIISNQQR
jgi:hypothetical protein